VTHFIRTTDEAEALLIRYRRSADGKPVAKALVYTQAEHRINRGGVDPDALRIVERLRESGHEAYIVGGAVRDLLLGRRPKDFDIVTDAQPARIKRVFRSARVIGRRFRLVHVYAGPKIFEVSTFRSIANGTVGNEFGTIDEDAHRRDFTLNALYYDPHDSTLVDYVGGFKDIGARRIEPVIPLKTIFKEDAVRMIRCVKYAATAGFRIPWKLRFALRRDSALLAEASPSRLTEEFLKILGSGSSAAIVASLSRFDLLRHILPEAARLLESSPAYAAALPAALAELDSHASDPSRERSLSLLLAHYLKPFLECVPDRLVDTPDAYREAIHEARLFLAPLNPPRVELEAAVLVVFKRRGLSPTQRPPRRSPSGRGQGPREGSPREPRAADQREGPQRGSREGRRKESQARAGGERAAAGERPAPARADDRLSAGRSSAEGEGAQGESSSAKRRRRRKRRDSQGGQGPRPASL
jgi:poly(A) polymerase